MLRAQSRYKFNKGYFNLLNNSLYGKTVEIIESTINIRICNDAKMLTTYTSKPTFKRSIKVDKDLIVAELIKYWICMDRPSYKR